MKDNEFDPIDIYWRRNMPKNELPEIEPFTEVNGDKIEEIVHRMLESSFWLPKLQSGYRYSRLQDDHDGTYQGRINVTIGEDADAWVETTYTEVGALRFRVPMIGGGMSQRVRTALVILAEAIRLDNEKAPLPRITGNRAESFVVDEVADLKTIDVTTIEDIKEGRGHVSIAAEVKKLDMTQLQHDVAAATAHRACCGSEHNPNIGKFHGCCVVCGVEWPCETAKVFLRTSGAKDDESRSDAERG